MNPSSGNRILSLDILRAAAILLVLGTHAPGIPEEAWGRALYAMWNRCGWAGVDLFFALSGFLILGMLLDERAATGSINAKAFVARRFFKIYPPYLVFLGALGFWVCWHTPGTSEDRLAAVGREAWPALVHLQNYFPMRSAPHLWSIAVEEHSYAALLILGIVATRGRAAKDPSRTIPWVLLTLFLLSWAGRWAHVSWVYEGSGPIGFTRTHNRLDALLAGAGVAWLTRARSTSLLSLHRGRAGFFGIGVLCFLPTLLLDISQNRVMFLLAVIPLQALGFGALLLGLEVGRAVRGSTEGALPPRQSRWIRPLAFVGISSYSTYLWHLPFARSFVETFMQQAWFSRHPLGPLTRFACFIALSLIAGILMYLLIEKPAQRWRQAWLQRRALQGVTDGRPLPGVERA